jgi:hypothetical protein
VNPDTDNTRADPRTAELRKELAVTDARRAQEDEAKAEEAVAAAQKEESKKERKRREAEERAAAATAEAEQVRARAGAPEPGPAIPPPSSVAAEEPDRPELTIAAAFVGAFLFARILKRIAE